MCLLQSKYEEIRIVYNFSLLYHILSTAGGFKKIAGGWVEYLIQKFYLSRGHVKSNVQSICDIISFSICDTNFHHDVRGQGAWCTLPRSMSRDLFFGFSYRFFPIFLYLSFSFYFPFYCAETSRAFEKKDKVKVDFRNLIF